MKFGLIILIHFVPQTLVFIFRIKLLNSCLTFTHLSFAYFLWALRSTALVNRYNTNDDASFSQSLTVFQLLFTYAFRKVKLIVF